MCGRKTLTKGRLEIIEELSIEEWDDTLNWEPSYNIAPTQITPVMLNHGKRSIHPMRWGLIPFWAKDTSIGSRMINARSETISEKPSFRNLLPKKRCIVVSDGYYEWKRLNGRKIPCYIRHPGKKLLPMAGLYDTWESPNGQSVQSYTVITTSPSPQLSEIHHRMPVILEPDDLDVWMDIRNHPPDEVLPLLKSYTPPLEVYFVSDFVNNVRNNSSECIRKTG